MISVSVYKQGNYPISADRVKKKLREVLEKRGITSNFSVSVAFVGEKKMEELVDKYYKGDPEKEFIHPILTFAASEVYEPFVTPTEESTDLGEIIISYGEAVKEAKETGKLIEAVVLALVEHGAMHLLGIHHN